MSSGESVYKVSWPSLEQVKMTLLMMMMMTTSSFHKNLRVSIRTADDDDDAHLPSQKTIRIGIRQYTGSHQKLKV